MTVGAGPGATRSGRGNDRSFDGIVLGAGINGLVLATYLARAGLRVALLDRRVRAGGGLTTEQATLPGFWHNQHSTNHFAIKAAPWWADLDLEGSVRYVDPAVDVAQPHEDGTCLLVLPDRDATAASIERHSPEDARTFRAWHDRAEPWLRHIFLPERFSEPRSWAERRALWGAAGEEFLQLGRRRPLDLVRELFRDPRVQALIAFKLVVSGVILTDEAPEGSQGAFVRGLTVSEGYRLVRGGSWNLAEALVHRFVAAGGVFVNLAHAARIVLEGGRATGVETADGRIFRARSFVASTLDPHQTFLAAIGEDAVPPGLRQRVERFRYAWWGLFGLHLALREPPRYRAADLDSRVQLAQKYHVGAETLDEMLAVHRTVEEGRLPQEPYFGGGTPTMLDPAMAPAGMHTAYAWPMVPAAHGGRPTELDETAGAFADRVLAVWSRSAPNMRPSNVLARSTLTPFQYSRDLPNMRGGDILIGRMVASQTMDRHFGYRTEVPGLYMAGSPTHPGGNTSGASGYIAASVIARDLDVMRWWQPPDLDGHAQALAKGTA